MAENINRQKIIAILGKRMSGKSTAAEILHNQWHDSISVRMDAYAVQSFVELHNMTLEQFLARPNIAPARNDDNLQYYQRNRALLGVYIEHYRKQNPDVFLAPLLAYIKNYPKIIIEDIYYFNELAALVQLGARIVWIEADPKKRSERYVGNLPINDPLEQEVGGLEDDLIRQWPNTFVVKNNCDVSTLRQNLRAFVAD